MVKCVLSGSFRKHLPEITYYFNELKMNNYQILSPRDVDIRKDDNDFILLKGDIVDKPEYIEISHLIAIENSDVLFVINPKNYTGFSTIFEMGYAFGRGKPIGFSNNISDVLKYYPLAFSFEQDISLISSKFKKAVSTKNLFTENVKFLENVLKQEYDSPENRIKKLNKNWVNVQKDCFISGFNHAQVNDYQNILCVGGLTVDYSKSYKNELRDVLLIQDNNWKGKFTILGKKVLKNEDLMHALLRGYKQELNLKNISVNDFLCSFKQLDNSGYYVDNFSQYFNDFEVRINSKVNLKNCEWWNPIEALRSDEVEPNAKITIKKYIQKATITA
ncbi:MAG: hypothetical protein WC393_02750 [Candidatus Nanoarchaeia archaeon]|jgi:nucleoside 2-deoxyribosyltransferase